MTISPHLETRSLTAWYGRTVAVRDVSIAFPRHTVTAIIGPSGCGKSTYLRCLNRLHEHTTIGRAAGEVVLDGTDVYAPDQDPVLLRRRIGMVFQHPNPFPTMTIFGNVAAGLRVGPRRSRADLNVAVERALRGAALWDEVHDRLEANPLGLSGGQQQRLCIARAIAPEPEVLLLDEPTSALDPVATLAIEELVQDLKSRFTIIMVTHNMQQAARVSDRTAFLYMGDLIEAGPTTTIFTRPAHERTEAYVTGRFG